MAALRLLEDHANQLDTVKVGGTFNFKYKIFIQNLIT